MEANKLEKPRFLITTAIEETWPTEDVPVLFLGEWCRDYARKSAWEKKNSKVAKYHWDDREKFFQDSSYLKIIYEELLSEVAEKLNNIHDTEHSLRYWRAVIGPWLFTFIQILFDRWEMVNRTLSENIITNVRVMQRQPNFLVPIDMSEFNRFYSEDSWNEMIYGQILDWIGFPVTKIEAFDRFKIKPFIKNTKKNKICIKTSLINGVSKLLAIFSRNDKYFFVSTYLGFFQDLILQAALGQFPRIWRAMPVPKVQFKQSIRNWNLLCADGDNGFSSLVRSFIPKHMPIAYLEGYRNLFLLTEALRWPKKPAVIFTSNSVHGDDVFKVWAAKKIENGSRLVIGQHGGCYGMLRWSSAEELEVSIADRFLTWGWSVPDLNKIVPVGILKVFGKRKVQSDQNGAALLAQLSYPRFSYRSDCAPVAAGQWLSYFEDQCRFVNALPKHIREKLLIRLYPTDYNNRQKSRWRDRFASISFDDEKVSMPVALKKARIFVSTYNATTYLETLSLNFPSIVFWNPSNWEFREDVQPYFELLEEVGVFHTNPESAALQMIKIWDGVENWWQSSSVQNARRKFCDQYAKIPDNFLAEIKFQLTAWGKVGEINHE